ncbi:MAG TPA: MarR family winged helix-turn-helix transcriptional regulator [Solirubrobacterales bacterium]|jgi:DNA-binding MarR family transcriptional regulator|nr:MarR family winged helix-turn-helix transcriptional regulator [Solirubrobacterales bacterium]
MANDWKIHGAHRPLPALLAAAKELAIAELHRRLGEEGHPQIRPGHGCVFRFIDVEGTRLTAIAERSGFTKQAVGEVVDDLERMDYVERVPDPEDRRAKIIRLTERGWEAQGAGQRIFADIERGWAERFGEERVATLREVLEEIVAEDAASTAAERPPAVVA